MSTTKRTMNVRVIPFPREQIEQLNNQPPFICSVDLQRRTDTDSTDCQVAFMREQLENMRFTDIELDGDSIHASSHCETKLSWDVRTGSPCT